MNNIKIRSKKRPSGDKKKKKDRAVLIYDEQHKLLKKEAFKTDREIREIASEAVDYYFKNQNN